MLHGLSLKSLNAVLDVLLVGRGFWVRWQGEMLLLALLIFPLFCCAGVRILLYFAGICD